MRLSPANAPDDCIAVIDAAGLLGIREIDFFRLAYRRWFGRDIRSLVLERTFAVYMFRDIVPPWVRHLSRVVLKEDAAGRLDLEELGAFRYRKKQAPHRHGRVYFGLTVFGVVIYCMALMEISYHPETSAPIYCHGGPGFRVLAQIAHGVSGKELPPCEALEPANRQSGRR